MSSLKEFLVEFHLLWKLRLRVGDHPHHPSTKKKKKAGTNFPFTKMEKACVDLF